MFTLNNVCAHKNALAPFYGFAAIIIEHCHNDTLRVTDDIGSYDNTPVYICVATSV